MINRRSIAIFALLLFTLLILSETKLTPQAQKFIEGYDDAEYHYGKIHFDKPLPHEILTDEIKTRAEKIELIKDFTAESQKDAIEILEGLYSSGEVSYYREIWICNVVSFYGNRNAFKRLADADLDAILDIDIPQDVLLEDDFEFTYDSLTWGIGHTDVENVWNRFGLTGLGQRLAIFDTGVQPSHPDLATQFDINEGEIPHNGIDDDDNGYVDDYLGYSFIEAEGNEIPWDDRGHGTHVGGTMVASAKYIDLGVGMAPGARLRSIKTINSTGNGLLADSWAAVGYTLEQGIKVANLSIGWRDAEDLDRSTWRQAITNARMLGLLIVVSAGNEGGSVTSCDDLRTPGDVPEALTVGGLTIVDYRDSYTAVGPVGWGDVSPWFDYSCPPGYIKPDIMAPGTRIKSCALFYSYMRKSGTSMATPHVTGACALLLQADSTLTPEEMIEAITSTAIDGGDPGRDNFFGYGLMDIVAAVEYVLGDIGYIKVFTEPYAKAIVKPGNLYRIADETGVFVLGSTEGSIRDLTLSKNGYDDYTTSCTFSEDTTEILAVMAEKTPALQTVFIHDFQTDSLIDSAMVVSNYGDTFFTSGAGVCYIDSYEEDVLELTVEKPGYIRRVAEYEIFGSRNRHIYLQPAMDFEDSDHGFSTSGDWEYGIPDFDLGPDARSGDKLMATVLDMKYNNLSDSWLQSPEIAIDSEKPTLYFHYWLSSEATDWGIWDGGNVSISTDGGSSFEIIFPEDFYDGHIDDYNEIMPWQPAYAGTLQHVSWKQEEFDLSGFSGDTVIVGFHFSSDDNTRYPGWYIDDFAIVQEDSRPPIIEDVIAIMDDEESTMDIGLKSWGVNCDIALDGVFAHFSLAGAEFDSTLCFLAAGSDSFYAHIDSFPAIFDMEYYFTSRDECGRRTRFPADSNLIGSFGEDTESPLITMIDFRGQTISRYDFKIKARIVDSLSGVDEGSIQMKYTLNGIADTLYLEHSERFCNTYVFYIPDTLANGDFAEFYIEAYDLAITPNYISSDMQRLYIRDIIVFDFDDEPTLDLAPDTVWSWTEYDGDYCWLAGNGSSVSPGLGMLIFSDLSLLGLENAYMTFDIKCDLPEEAGTDIKLDGYVLEPVSGYTTLVPRLDGFGLGGHIDEWTSYTVLLDDYIGERSTLQFRFGSEGGTGFYAMDNLTFYAFPENIDDRNREDFKPHNKFTIYPNPANSVFNIECQDCAKIEIYDIEGKLVDRIENDDKTSWHASEDIESGIYFIRAFSKNGNTKSQKALLIR